MLQKQEKYMRVRTDTELFSNMSREQVITGLKNIIEFEINDENSSLEERLKKLMKFERTRSLSLWHDGPIQTMVIYSRWSYVYMT